MKLWSRLFLFPLLFSLLAAPCFGAGLADKVQEHTLKNGMKLLLVERHTSPTVAAWIRFRVGSVDERSDERGLAHLLEHMLFKGTTTLGTTDYAAEKPLLDRIEATAQLMMLEQAKRDKGDKERIAEFKKELSRLEAEAAKYVIKEEFFQIYARNGGTGYNAFTSKDGTTYLINIPANKLELWAAIESDRMQNAVLREFYSERNVVMEERRRSAEAEPMGRLWEAFQAASFVAHPYGQPTIGWMSDIEYLSRAKAEAFLHKYYAPNNAIVAIVGDINPEATIALVEKYFGGIPPGTPVGPVMVEEPPQAGEKRIEIVGDAEPQLVIGFHKPTLPNPDEYVFDVIDMLLTEGRTSRLYKKLVLEKQLVTEVGTFTAPGSRYPNLFVVEATPRAPHSVYEVEKAIHEELERLKTEPVSDRELQQIVNRLEYEEFRQMGSNGGLARNLTEYEAVTGSWRYLIEHRRKVAAVTPADVARVARKYFTEENRTVGFITKKEGGTAMITCKRLFILLIAVMALSSCAVSGSSVNPRTMTFPPLKFAIPKSDRAVLPNGITVYMLEDHELPLVNITAYIHVASIYEPEDKVGLAGLTGSVMRSGGTSTMAPEKLDAELEFMASSIEASIGSDAGNVSMATLAKNFDRTAELFAQVLMTPAFREDRVKLAVNKSIEALRRQNDDPKEVANRELTKALYPAHPLGRFPTIETVKKITRADLAEFHRRYFHPGNMVLAVSGDFKKDEMLARLTGLFGAWEKESVIFPQVGEPAPEVKPEILFVRKEVSQSVIRMGELGIDKNNPDLYALRVMDYILGGGFTSRLTQEVRSNQGLAYNVESSVNVGRRFIGTITAETETKSASTVRAITLIRDIIAGMTTAPVTDQELALAKDSMINSFIFGFTKPDVIVNQQARLEFFGYPAGYLENFRDNIARVTREDVSRVAGKYLHPAKMVLLVVGDDQKFDKPLSIFGPVREIKLENGK